MIETRQLRYFAAVADYLHFGNAAESLCVAQSALSTQVMQLEQHLGVRLLNRSKRSAVSLTEAGQIFLVEVRQALKQLQRTERIGLAAARGEIGRIELGYVASAAVSNQLPALATKIRQDFPGVELGLTLMDSPTQLRSIEDGLLDAGIIRARATYPAGIEATLVQREGLSVAMSMSNALAERPSLTSADLIHETLIVPDFEDNAGFSNIVTAFERSAGGRINKQIRVNDFISGLTLAVAGHGIVLIPTSFRNLLMAQIIYREISDFDETLSLVFVRKVGRSSPALSRVTEVVLRMGSVA